MKSEDKDKRDANRDPLTGAPGSHPVGTGIGAAAGGMAAGAAIGTFAGPAGIVIGLAAGAVIGGLAGKEVGEAFDPTVEDTYWSKHYADEPYYQKGYGYDDYAPAYRIGYSARHRFGGRSFADSERDLEAAYIRDRGTSRLAWNEARAATRAAWDRV